jgi:hypothetical protein
MQNQIILLQGTFLIFLNEEFVLWFTSLYLGEYVSKEFLVICGD